MRLAIAALMTVFLVGSIFAQDAPSASDATQPTSSSDATSPPAAPSDQTTPSASSAAAPSDQTPAPSAAPADQTPAPAPAATEAPAPAPATAANASPPSAFAFAGGVNLGSDVLLTGANNGPQTWTRLGFQPDLSFGKIGVGFDLTIHFMLYPDPNTAVSIYPGDWVPNYQGDGKSFLDIYLPKIMYVRYGLKGSDPFFAKLGSIDDLSLGNGFIMSDYSNMLFLPQQRIFGLDLGLDGSLFNFPYAGAEIITGNLARFDVDGARFYARPLIGTSIPIVKNMQVGGTIVVDTNPYLYINSTANALAAYGVDVTVPILGGNAFPLAAFTDFAIDPNTTAGWMLGVGGRIIGIFTYGAQLRVMQDEFIPSYFDANYDLYRADKHDFMLRINDYATMAAPSGAYNPSWLASIGTSLLSDKLVFNVGLDGPFSVAGVFVPTGSVPVPDQTQYPHLRGVLRLDQLGTFPFYFDASYEKYDIGATTGFFQDLVDPTNAVIGLDLNYKTGASVLTLSYDAKWDPSENNGKGQFDVTSSLQASMKF